jgi:replicative DNA helicase
MESKVEADQHTALRERLDYVHHQQQLVEESGITPQVILDRGYRTVTTKAELNRLGFSKTQQLAPALAIPMYGPTGELVTHQIRPDSPRKDRDGKPIKYETPAKSRVHLDVHPSQTERVKDREDPLWITEGVKKADCLVSHGQCAVALQGVWCWQKDGLPLPEWEDIKLHGRTVYVVFDSDVMTKSAVHAALKKLVAFLVGRGAKVNVVYLPDGEGGKKQGVDDYLVAGGAVEELKRLAKGGLREHYETYRYEEASEDSANSANSANGGSQLTQARPWEQPAPFHTFDPPSFPTETLPDWAKDFVEAEANATQTPVDLASMLTLSAGALACAKVVEVEPWDGWREPVNLYTATAMPSGSRKSAVFNAIMAPVEEFETRRVEEKAPEIDEQQTRFKIYEGRLQKAQKAAANAKDEDLDLLTAEAIQAAEDLASIKVPAQPRLLADDASPERLATLLRDQGGRMALASPEGDVFDMMAGRYSQGVPNLGVYLKGHAGDTIRVDRVGRPPEYVKRPALTLALAVQPDVLRGLGNNPTFRGRGLLGRLLYCLPEILLGQRKDNADPVPNVVKTTYARKVKTLLNMSPDEPVPGDSIEPKTLRMDGDAQRKMREFAAWLEPQLAEYGELGRMTDWAGKLAGAVARIAGVLHCMEYVSKGEGSGKPWDENISGVTVEHAVKIGRYLIPHARAAFAEMGTDPMVEDAKHVLRWIEHKGVETLTKREAFEGTKGRFRRVTALEPALDLLVAHGYIRKAASPERKGPGRKPSARYVVSPFLNASAPK